jgi:hypothetical protein
MGRAPGDSTPMLQLGNTGLAHGFLIGSAVRG